ncbi:MAG: DUF4465 domain-containing protein [Planctomycetota bacterium]
MTTHHTQLPALLVLLLGVPAAARGGAIDFEQPALGAAVFENGQNWPGEFAAGGAVLNNAYDTRFGSWSGWALSRATDTTTPGFTNQYSAWPGGGAVGSVQYAVAYSGADVGAGVAPVITLPAGATPVSADIANTTYAALSMQTGDQFAKAFGGPTGDDPDWFLLTINALDAAGATLASLPFYLADFRPADNSQDFIREGWTTVDLSPLGQPASVALEFRLTSSDNAGGNGMNTPAYFALDNLVLQTTPPGDFNGDGLVDGADYALWRNTAGPAEELDLWRANFGAPSPPATALAAAGVPEPAAACVLLASLGPALLRRRPINVPSGTRRTDRFATDSRFCFHTTR